MDSAGEWQTACTQLWQHHVRAHIQHSGLETDGSVAVVGDGWRNWCAMKLTYQFWTCIEFVFYNTINTTVDSIGHSIVRAPK